jgi:hypothetical protein
MCFLAPSAAAATAQGAALAYTPASLWGAGITQRLRVQPEAIYMIDRSAREESAGRVFGDPRLYTAYDARVSPTGDLVAFHGTMKTLGPRGTGEGIGVLGPAGEIVAFLPRGMSFAWSPEGTRLAVVVLRNEASESSARWGVMLWDRRDYSVGILDTVPSRVGWAGEDSLLLQLGDRVASVDCCIGQLSTTGHHGTLVSPDGLYSMWPGEGGRDTRVFEDETNRDVTDRLFGPLRDQGLREIRSAFWVWGVGADHFMCVSGSDHLYLGTPRCVTEVIDADTGETIGSFPGEALGPSGDGRTTVVLHHDSYGFETVNLEEIVQRWIDDHPYY